MYSPSIFVTPTASTHQDPLHSSVQAKVTRKRKRPGQNASSQTELQLDNTEDAGLDHALSKEYTAVVTPLERSQRRLAGLDLDQQPPPLPFPHARVVADAKERYCEDVPSRPAKISLHLQHIAAMTAIVHRSIMAEDYHRAGRAVGLLLRNEVNGQPLDIRRAGLWGIGAEVLLRNSTHQERPGNHSGSERPAITRESFERAKLFYERLIVQYPPHKTWPDAINSRDFCIALFELWIYVTDHESIRMQSELGNDGSSAEGSNAGLLDAKKWELLQARLIADAMDVRMRDATFNNDHELIRLRAMVALWTADLLDKCEQLEEEDESTRRLQEHHEDVLSDGIERVVLEAGHITTSNSDANDAVSHRTLANLLLKKLHDIPGAELT